MSMLSGLRRFGWLVFALTLSALPAQGAVILSDPVFSDADSFKLFLELDAPLDFTVDAVEVKVNFDAPLTQSAVNPVVKLAAVPGTFESAVPTIGFINYLLPASIQVGQLFEFSFDGAVASPSTVNVILTIFPTGIEEPVEFPRSVEVAVSAVPEPSTTLLLLVGLLGVAGLRARRTTA